MAIESIGAVDKGLQPQQQAISDESLPGEGTEEFSSVLDSASALEQPQAAQAPPETHPIDAAPTIPAPASVETTQPVAATEPADGVEPSGVAEILERIGDGHARLDALIAEVRSGQSFTVQELLGLQAEVYKLTLELESTTTMVSEGIKGFNRLMQQQV